MIMWLDKQCNRMELEWKNSSKRRKIWIYIGVYSVVFLVAALFVFSPFIYGRKSFVGGGDGHYESWPALIYIGKWWREYFRHILQGSFEPKLFDLSIGMGADVIGTLNFFGFGDPLCLLSMVVPTEYTELLYISISVLFLYFSGLSFSYLCRYFQHAWRYALIGSIVYCFCGYAVQSSGDWVLFCRPMIYLPLMIVGADKIMREQKPYVFITAAFGAALGGFYFLYMMTLITGFYVIIRSFVLFRKKHAGAFFRATARISYGYLLGIGLAALIFLPACYAYFESGRSDGNPVISPSFIFSKQWYKTNLAVIFAPFGEFDEWNYQSFAVISLFAVVVLLFERKNGTLKAIVLVAFAVYLTAIGGKIMNGFAYPINRWTFGLALVLAYVVVEELPELQSLSGRNLKICLATGLVLSIFLFSVEPTDTTRNIVWGIVFTLASLLIFVIVHPKVQDAVLMLQERCFAFKRFLASGLCLLLVISNVGIYGIYELDSSKSAFATKFPTMGEYTSTLSNHAIKNMQPYLYNNPKGRADFSAKSSFRNLGMLFQVPTIPYYWTLTNKNVTDYWIQTESPGLQTAIKLYNSDWRTIMSSLLSVKYFETDKAGIGKLPYGYSLIKESDGLLFYENEFSLPWGYFYDKVMSYDELNAMNGLQKQEAMLQALALNESESYTKGLIEFDEETVPYEIECVGCKWDSGTLTVSKANATIFMSFKVPANSEGYIRLCGFHTSKTFDVSVTSGGITRSVDIQAPTALRYYEHENYLINLGYSENERTELTITFSKKGSYQLDDIELYALPMDNYPERIEALRAEPLENIQWGTNSLTGTVDLSKDKILCVSVPYSKGWSATVDGEKVEILRGNYMFMCIPLTAGHHDIAFHYCSPGIKLGAAVSVISMGIVVGMLVRDRRKKTISMDEKTE